MDTNFLENLKNVLNQAKNNESITENGAVGYKTTGKSLLDLNFQLSSMRNWDEDAIWSSFLKAYNENPLLSVVWLFFVRDIRGGCGERRTFRLIMSHLSAESPELVSGLLHLVPEYGRWDDLIWLSDNMISKVAKKTAKHIICEQFLSDYEQYLKDKPVSLLAKWMPSICTSSSDTVRLANIFRDELGMTPREYRKRLSMLRAYLNIVETKMSANEWSEVDYESVPSKAGMIYRNAFVRHDSERYEDYLVNVRNGNAKMNANVLFPYEIVHAYMNNDSFWDENDVRPYDETLELKWNNFQNTVSGDNSTLVVVDGSGSMSTTVGSTGITCHDVARSLGIYFAERLTGGFHNSFITFSSEPKLVRFDGIHSLNGKLNTLVKEDDCSNTNIEKTFELILRTAVKNHMKQDEIPANILIISDMEFDAATLSYSRNTGYTSSFDKKLFEAIGSRWKSAGYKLPRLVFWNVCSRTGTVPVTENELGVALVSGFSPNIADMVMSGELDPWKLLVDKLRSARYEKVWNVVMPS